MPCVQLVSFPFSGLSEVIDAVTGAEAGPAAEVHVEAVAEAAVVEVAETLEEAAAAASAGETALHMVAA